MSESSGPPKRSSRAPSAAPDARTDTPSRRPAGAKSINDAQMAAVQRFLAAWVARNCTGADGQPWSQRAIADSLGITQNEYSAWTNDRARPGLPRVIRLREMTGATLEEILGL